MKRPDSNIYVGRLEGNRPVVYAVGKTTAEPLGSRALLAWGTDAPDAGLALARTLLADASGGAEPPAEVCCRFADQIVRRLPPDGFALPRDTVNAWLSRVVAV